MNKMKNPWRSLILGTGCLLAFHLSAVADTLIIKDAETAGIAGHRPLWDRPVVLSAEGMTEPTARGNSLKAPAVIWAPELDWHYDRNLWLPANTRQREERDMNAPGANAFDAVHRSMLVRFPKSAELIAEKLNQGYAIEKAELILPFKDTEKLSRGYRAPSSFVGQHWDKIIPRWHAVAWPLRKPWQADPRHGPTFNAFANGHGYWTRHGATDPEHDRYPVRFGPSEISCQKTEALDITAVLTQPEFGKTLAERLRSQADNGFIIRKDEYYDAAFTTPQYEWASMIGGRAILVGEPELRVTFKRDPKAEKPGRLPPPADPVAVAKRNPGKPTAVIISPEEFEHYREQFALGQPEGMPDWQWQRVQELAELSSGGGFPETYDDYVAWIDGMLMTQPRRWDGFSAIKQLALVNDYFEALPSPIQDHWELYWTAWLMPHRATRDMVHNQYHQIFTPWRSIGSDYHDETGDWRGNSSFYRES